MFPFPPFSVNYIGHYQIDLKDLLSHFLLCPANLLTCLAIRWLKKYIQTIKRIVPESFNCYQTSILYWRILTSKQIGSNCSLEYTLSMVDCYVRSLQRSGLEWLSLVYTGWRCCRLAVTIVAGKYEVHVFSRLCRMIIHISHFCLPNLFLPPPRVFNPSCNCLCRLSTNMGGVR